MSEPFILDADPFIPCGVPADAERVAELIADPANDIDESIIEQLPEEQRPTQEMLVDAADAALDEQLRDVEPLTKNEASPLPEDDRADT